MRVFIFGSFETTAASLASFLLCMCEFPDKQEQAHEYVRDILGEGTWNVQGTFVMHSAPDWPASKLITVPDVLGDGRVTRLLHLVYLVFFLFYFMDA